MTKKDLKNIFPERLKHLREKKHLKQTVLSDLCGLHRSAVSEYEKNERKPSIDALVSIADFFEVSVDYLIGR